MMEQIQGMMLEQRREDEEAVHQVLSKQQVARLEQIRLQIIGPIVVAEEGVAQNLNLAEEQFEQIHEIVTQMDEEVAALAQAGMDQMRTQFMRQNPPNANNPGGRGGAPAAAKKAADPNADPEGDPAANAQAANQQRNGQNTQRFQAMAEQATKLAEEQDVVTQRAEKAIGKVLTSRQKKNFNGMLGAEFDLTRLVATDQNQNARGPGGRRGQAGANSNPPAATPAAGDTNPDDAAPAETDKATTKPAGRNRPAPRVRGQATTSDSG